MHAAAAVQGDGYYEKASGPVDINIQTSNLHPFISYTCFSFGGSHQCWSSVQLKLAGSEILSRGSPVSHRADS